MRENNLIDDYCEYIQNLCPELDIDSLFTFAEQIAVPILSDPKTAIELNNFAVMALIEAENTDDLELRRIKVSQALEALYKGAEQNTHPVCLAHYALIQGMLGNHKRAMDIAFSGFLTIIQFVYSPPDEKPLALVYLPPKYKDLAFGRDEQLQNLLLAENGYKQAMLLLLAALNYYNFIFYNLPGISFLRLASQILTNSSAINLQLGVSLMFNDKNEGLFNLQKARSLAPHYAPAIQALYLAHRDLKTPKYLQFWYELAQSYQQKYPDALDWGWVSLSPNSLFTYIPFENYLLTVESTLKSVVTAVLLAQGDWFEYEMEFWRNELQPGMTVIDVGANVGVYTFSAARCVGSTGKVIAVEPFKFCVECLNETCRVNDLSWVKVYEAAASDRPGNVLLTVENSSVFNQVLAVDDPQAESDKVQKVASITLDSLIDKENLTQLDWLKIDAEGHEMQVLQGSDRLLKEFTPKIIYENLAGNQSSNTEVNEFLQAQGYTLFTYRPYLQQLVKVESPEQLQQALNIIAIPFKYL